jgi:asparagine synthase (glutamine-hydrolysing)
LEARYREFGRDPHSAPPADPVWQRIRFFQYGPAATGLPGYTAGMRAQFGLDIRYPAADRRLVEFCLALPEDQYRRDGVSRWLVRRLLNGALPDSVVWDSRRELQAPDWHERLALERPGLERQINALAACTDANELIDLERLRRLVREWPSGHWEGYEAVRSYRFILQRGLAAGRFIRWIEGGNE